MNLFKHQRWTRRQALWLISGAVSGLGLHACAQSAKTSLNQNPSTSTAASIGITTWINPGRGWLKWE